MKKALIISNITKKFQAGHFSMITPLEEMGYEVHWAANLSEYQEDIKNAPCIVHQIDFIRNPLNPKNYKAYKQLMELLKREKFDVIHCQSPVGGVLGRICGKKAKVRKIIYTVHGFHFYKGAPLINNTLYKMIEGFLARHTDALITINTEDYEYSKKMKFKKDGKSYYINGIGVDLKKDIICEETKEKLKNDLKIKNDNVICISVGELNKNKNQKVMIEAISNMNNRNIKLLLCGVGPEEKNLKDLCGKLEVENQVSFLGFRNDIKELLSISDIFILASHREGLSRSIMEAMTSALPCIVSNIRGNIDLIENEKGGYLINQRSLEELSDKIKILENKETRIRMGKHNEIKVQENGVENIKEKMREIYKEILKNKRRKK